MIGSSRAYLRTRTVALARRLSGTVTRVEVAEPAIALTFDDGPNPACTPALLKLLETHHAKAMFFVLGRHAARWPQLVRAIVARGHTVANHSWDHVSLPLLPRRRRLAQIVRTARLLKLLGGTRLFRPPYGHQTWRTRLEAALCRHEVIAWSADPVDYQPDQEPGLTERLRAAMQPGNIVLLHDYIFRPDGGDPVRQERRALLVALETILNETAGRMAFVTVPALMQHGPAVRSHWTDLPGPAELPALRMHATMEASYAR